MQGFSTTLLSYTVLPVVCMRNISGSHFPCPPLTHLEPAQSVHQLKPSDVKVVGAMGDSLTAGLRVLSRDFFDVPFEDRGVAWSGGRVLCAVTYLISSCVHTSLTCCQIL